DPCYRRPAAPALVVRKRVGAGSQASEDKPSEGTREPGSRGYPPQARRGEAGVLPGRPGDAVLAGAPGAHGQDRRARGRDPRTVQLRGLEDRGCLRLWLSREGPGTFDERCRPHGGRGGGIERSRASSPRSTRAALTGSKRERALQRRIREESP